MNYYVNPETSEFYGYDDEQVAQGHVSEGLVLCDAPPSPRHTWVDGAWAAPAPTMEEIIAANIKAVEDEMNRRAKAKGYDDIKSAALRAGYPGPFQEEGIKFATWMDTCWANAYFIMDEVIAGRMVLPTPAECVSLMPELALNKVDAEAAAQGGAAGAPA